MNSTNEDVALLACILLLLCGLLYFFIKCLFFFYKVCLGCPSAEC